MANKPGRYDRTASGLLGAMLVLLAVTLGFVVFRELFRNELSVEPEAIDYLAVVKAVQESDPRVIYPQTLPDGWMATSVNLLSGDVPQWRLGMLTAEGQFAGVHSDDGQIRDALSTYVDEDVAEGDKLALTTSVASTWQVFTDTSGDTAYVAELEDRFVMVYGSASPEELQQLMSLLGTDSLSTEVAGFDLG